MTLPNSNHHVKNLPEKEKQKKKSWKGKQQGAYPSRFMYE
jgi:hypothetical protein